MPPVPPGAGNPRAQNQVPGQGQEYCTSCRQPIPLCPCRQTSSQPVNFQRINSQTLMERLLVATGEELKRIQPIVDFVEWILQSEFLRLQQPEPIVGDPQENNSKPFPEGLEKHGIRGESTYTALIHHDDTFTCKICDYVVKAPENAELENAELENAITHQRVVHFGHYPYRCPQAQCALRFANQTALSGHQIATGH